MQSYLPPSNIKFEVANEEGKFHNLFYTAIFIRMFVRSLKESFGIGLENNFIDIVNEYCRYVVDRSVFDKVALVYFNKTKKNPGFAEQINAELFALMQKSNLFSEDLLKTNFSKTTNVELIDYCKSYYELQTKMIVPGMLPVIMEIKHPLYTDFLTQIVQKRAAGKNISVAEAVAVLSSFDGETLAKEEQHEMLKLAIKVKTLDNISKFSNQLRQHAAKFGWLAYGYGGPAWTEKEYGYALESLLNENPAATLEHLDKSQVEIEQKKKHYEQVLDLTDEEKRFFQIACDFMRGKALRKEAMSFACYASEPLHKEIAKRLNLSFLQVRFMVLEEIVNALTGGKVDESELTKRTKHVVYGLFENGNQEVILSGAQADKYDALIFEERIDRELKELRGQCACPGNAVGTVKIIHKPEEMKKMQKGDVLVSYATTPDIVSAMRLASAIVTDMGGLTSHAAIVSREMNLPCIIGTKIATKVFKDGEKVAVDATNGIIRKLDT